MIDPIDLELRIRVQAKLIADEACCQAFRWQMHQTRGFDYVPPLFVNAELPVVPRVALPRIEGAARKQGRQ